MASPLPWRRLRLLLLVLVVALTFTCEADASGNSNCKPNIIFILEDDAGFADFENTDPSMVTPNIETLRTEGLFLNQSYMHPSCGPSRSALLSGRYPHTWGAQIPNVMSISSAFYPTQRLEYLGDVMKKQGYATHALGKWHQGHCHPSLTPLGRGFDTFYGMLAGAHTSHYYHSKTNDWYDWWDDDKVDFAANGTYSTTLLNNRMVRIINESSQTKPFFAYLAYQAPHGPWEVDDEYLKFCKHVEDKARRVHCAIMYVIDQGVGMFVDALTKKGIYDDTVIIVTSDNGGTGPLSGSYNYPLRSKKGSLYEGGVRVYTVLKAPGLNKTNETWPGLFQGVDWMPTLVGMAGGEKEDWMHGFNLWPDIKAFRESSRKEVFYHYDDRNMTKKNHKAYRFGRWKIIQGYPGKSTLFPLPGVTMEPDSIRKGKYGPDDFQLYNLVKDPSERKDMAQKNTNILERMKRKMNGFLKRYKLQPYVTHQTGQFKNSTTGVLNNCFCHPPWAEDTKACPSP